MFYRGTTIDAKSPVKMLQKTPLKSGVLRKSDTGALVAVWSCPYVDVRTKQKQRGKENVRYYNNNNNNTYSRCYRIGRKRYDVRGTTSTTFTPDVECTLESFYINSGDNRGSDMQHRLS